MTNKTISSNFVTVTVSPSEQVGFSHGQRVANRDLDCGSHTCDSAAKKEDNS